MSSNLEDKCVANYENIESLLLDTPAASQSLSNDKTYDLEPEVDEDPDQFLNESQNLSSSKSENTSACVEADISSSRNISNGSAPASSSNSKSNVPDETTLDEGDSLLVCESLSQSPKKVFLSEGSPLPMKEPLVLSKDRKASIHSSQCGQTTSELSSSESPPQQRFFFCREWVWSKLMSCLEQRPSVKTSGILVIGGAGSGKTAICSQLVNPSCVHGRQAAFLQSRIIAHHFCLGNDASSLSVSSFIQSLVVQLAQSPYIAGYGSKIAMKEVVQSLDPLSLQKDPDEAFQKAIVFPLLEIENPDKPVVLLVDSVDEVSLQSYNDVFTVNGGETHSKSSTILQLLSNHHHLLPHWLLLVITARRSNHTRALARNFSGFRKIALDDLRRSHVIRDVQQYILCRLDTEPALRYQLSRETAEMLNQLHIKSNGCFLYLEKVLDGVVEGWVTLREIKDIPGTLNGLYLWLCQRLYPRKHFQRVLPLLSVILASRSPLTQLEIQEAASTHIQTLSNTEWNKRWSLLRRVLCPYTKEVVVLFHHSFAEWLLDIKHCTQKYLVDVNLGHAMLAMKMSLRAPYLSPLEVQTFAFHLARVPMKPPLESFHLPLWLVTCGVDVSSCFNQVGLKDNLSFKILQEAGASLKPGSNTTSSDEDAEDDLALEYADIPGKDVFEEEMEKRIEQSVQILAKSNLELSVGKDGDSNTRERRSHSSLDRHSQGSRNSHQEDIIDRAKQPDYQDLEDSDSNTKMNYERRKHEQREDPLFPYLRGGPIDGSDAAGRTLLHTAAHQGDASLVDVLLQRGASHDLRDRGGQTPLNLAARHGHADVIAVLLSHGAHPDHADDDGWTSLRSAAWGGYVQVVDILLKGGAQADLADTDGRTALRAAAWSGHEDVVATLLENGADVNKADSEGRTPLIAAAYMGHFEIVASLIAGGANVNHCDKDGRSALSVGVLCVTSLVGDIGIPAGDGRLQVVTTLLEGGANVDHQDKDGLTPLLVSSFEGHVDVCELLLEYDADVDHIDRSGRTSLLAAASMGHASVVEKLLFWGCYVDHIDVEGRTVLSVAAAQGSQETVRLLLDRGLDETHRDNAGWTPLHYASFEGHKDVCESLLQSGARINEVDNDGKHALVLAAQEGHVDVVSSLLDNGAFLHHTSHDGRSAFRVAALEGHKEVVHLLLCRGADIHYKDADGRSTLYLLALENHIGMATFLLKSGSDVESKDLEGRTPLHVTAWQGHVPMVELLLGHGAHVDAEDNEKRTPLQSAAWQGNAAIVSILLQHGAKTDHSCSQGATALSIAAQEGHEECVALLLKFGADPGHSDRCGRTAIKVALKGGHLSLAKMLEEHLEKQKAQNIAKIHYPIDLITHSKYPPNSSLLHSVLTSSPTGSPESTFDKRRSFLSLEGRSSSKSSCNLSSSTRSSAGGGGFVANSTNTRGLNTETSHNHTSNFPSQQPNANKFNQQSGPNPLFMGKPPPVTSAPPIPSQSSALTFTQQLQQCGRPRNRRNPQLPQAPLTPLDDPASPIYASPPISPVNDDPPPLPQRVNPLVALMEEDYALPCFHSRRSQSKSKLGKSLANKLSFPSDRSAKSRVSGKTNEDVPNYAPQISSKVKGGATSVAAHTHSISNAPGGCESSSSAASGFTFTQDSHMRIILGTGSPESRPPKRNGVVTGNPSLKAAQAKAASILRNGLTGKSKQESFRPNFYNIKKETPL